MDEAVRDTVHDVDESPWEDEEEEEQPYELTQPTEADVKQSRRKETITYHTFTVTLPGGTPCRVDYTRLGSRSHQFYFWAPIRERIWIDTGLEGSVGVIEAKAQELVPEAFREAQRTEQEEMRRATPPFQWRATPGEQPQLDKKLAAKLAGKYAVGVRFTSGRILRIGLCYDTPEPAIAEIREGKHSRGVLYVGQVIQVYICCRFARRWVEPRLLVERVVVEGTIEMSGPKTKPTAAGSAAGTKRTRRAGPAKATPPKTAKPAKSGAPAKPARAAKATLEAPTAPAPPKRRREAVQPVSVSDPAANEEARDDSAVTADVEGGTTVDPGPTETEVNAVQLPPPDEDVQEQAGAGQQGPEDIEGDDDGAPPQEAGATSLDPVCQTGG